MSVVAENDAAIEVRSMSDIAGRADRLLSLWSSLSMRHVALGAACGCGAGGFSLRLQDFETDIVGYLEDIAQRSAIGPVMAWAREMQQLDPQDKPMRFLFEQIGEGRLDPAVSDWLLPKIERTLESYAELHGSSKNKETP